MSLLGGLVVVLLLAGTSSAGTCLSKGTFSSGDITDKGGESVLAEGADEVLLPPNSTRTDNMHFGQAVDSNGTSGRRIAVSAPLSGPDVFIYNLDTAQCKWEFARDFNINAIKGPQALAVDDDTLVIKQEEEVEVYKRSPLAWFHQDTINLAEDDFESVGEPVDSVDVSGNHLVLSDVSDGHIAVYQRGDESQWSKEFHAANIPAPSVAIQQTSDAEENILALGWPAADRVVVYKEELFGGWYEYDQLGECDGSGCPDSIGASVDMAPTVDHKIISGAPDSGPGEAHTWLDGADQYVHESKLTPSDGGFEDTFGNDVAAWDGTSVVGNKLQDFGADGRNAGSAYVYDAGVEEGQLIQERREGGELFGSSVSYRGNYAMVGAPQEAADGFSDLGYIGFFN